MRDFTAVEAVIKCMNERRELNDDMIVRVCQSYDASSMALAASLIFMVTRRPK